MIDCPNCGKENEAANVLCWNCGFDLHSQHADAVRKLREEGRIHPGRLSPEERARDAVPSAGNERGGDRTSLPAESASETPEEIDAGL